MIIEKGESLGPLFRIVTVTLNSSEFDLNVEFKSIAESDNGINESWSGLAMILQRQSIHKLINTLWLKSGYCQWITKTGESTIVFQHMAFQKCYSTS